jgi:prevent-host-death family protein
MQEEIGSYDAKTKLPEILRRVEQGESFTITNRGKPVADLVPSRSASKQRAEVAIKNIIAGKKYPVSDKELTDMKESGRK